MNDSEAKVKGILEAHGWKVFRNGWPDFLCETTIQYKNWQALRMIAVEVKSGNDKLRPEQVAIKERLQRIGLTYCVARPESLDPAVIKGKRISKHGDAVALARRMHLIDENVDDLQQEIVRLQERLQGLRAESESIAFLFSSSEEPCDRYWLQEFEKEGKIEAK